MTQISRDKAQKILNMILEYEKEFEKDDRLSEMEATNRIKKIVEGVVDAIEVIEVKEL